MNATGTERPPVTLRIFRSGDEEAVVELLNSAFPHGWGTLERWKAKHTDRPGFDPRDIYLAESGGKLIGCLHSAVLPVRIGPDLSLLHSLDGDLAVHPEGRGRGIPEELYRFSRRLLHERGVPLRGGYTEAGLWEHFYRTRIGYVSDFETVVSYRKILSADFVRNRLLGLFHSAADAPDPGHGPILEVAITGLDPFQIRLGQHEVAMVTANGHGPTLRMEADQRVLGLFAPGGRGLRGLLPLWLRGAIRFRRLVTGALPLALWFLLHGLSLMRKPTGR